MKKDIRPQKEFKDTKLVDRQAGEAVKTFATQMEEIRENKLNKRKKTRECMRCAWPVDRKGNLK
jgi:hypothetical protein